jgi:hypothetical protein
VEPSKSCDVALFEGEALRRLARAVHLMRAAPHVSHRECTEQTLPARYSHFRSPAARRFTSPLATSKPPQQDTLAPNRTMVGTTVKDRQEGGNEKRVELPWETLTIGLGKKALVVEVD